MAMPKRQIIEEIERYVGSVGGPYYGWYVGIAKDPRARLFNDHDVSEPGGAWIHCPAESSDIAREIEKYFLGLGMDGGGGGGDYSTTTVYAYRKTRETDP